MYFVNYLRAIAAILITNSHYGEIWPISSLAAGGLLGNVLFFAISGFCLFNIKENFGKWYLKRFLRIYPVVIVFTLITVVIGFYPLKNFLDAIRLFVFPTSYIFIVWLMLCYVGFYVVAYLDKKINKFTEKCLFVLAVVWLAVYLIFIDKSYYHIDEVHKPFILFLYFGCMLLGGIFRKYYFKFTETKKVKLNALLLVVSIMVYFATKVLFMSVHTVSFLQIINQFTIFAVVFFVFTTFIGLEEKLKKIPKGFNKPITFLSKITLQIYVVQFVIIANFKYLVFPLDFIIVTALILVVASALYLAELYIRKAISKLKERKRENKNAESEN